MLQSKKKKVQIWEIVQSENKKLQIYNVVEIKSILDNSISKNVNETRLKLIFYRYDLISNISNLLRQMQHYSARRVGLGQE